MSLDFYLEENYCDKCCRGDTVFYANITHNLNKMADKAGIYKCLWCPEELGFEFAKQITPSLEAGIEKLKLNPAKYHKLNPPNGWGDYAGLFEFAEKVLEACRCYPEAKIVISR